MYAAASNIKRVEITHVHDVTETVDDGGPQKESTPSTQTGQEALQ
jgi:hypothetical protein